MFLITTNNWSQLLFTIPIIQISLLGVDILYCPRNVTPAGHSHVHTIVLEYSLSKYFLPCLPKVSQHLSDTLKYICIFMTLSHISSKDIMLTKISIFFMRYFIS